MVVIDDVLETAEMAAAPLSQAGHEVLAAVVPIDWEAVMHFGPQVIVSPLYRRTEAQDRPIGDPVQDVIGYEGLLATKDYPAAAQVLPIVLLGIGVKERDLDTQVHYDLFLRLPDDVKLFAPKVLELATKVKSRRKISGYVCPNPGCGSRLVFLTEPARDLFCPRCHTSVAIADQRRIVYMPEGKGESIEGTLDLITPPASAGNGHRG